MKDEYGNTIVERHQYWYWARDKHDSHQYWLGSNPKSGDETGYLGPSSFTIWVLKHNDYIPWINKPEKRKQGIKHEKYVYYWASKFNKAIKDGTWNKAQWNGDMLNCEHHLFHSNYETNIFGQVFTYKGSKV